MKITVIIADDHPIVRKGMIELFNKADGFSLLEAVSNGMDAVTACSRHQPDMILMDIAMPQLNGLEAARIIREQSPHTKIVLVSMHLREEEYLREALFLRVDGFMDKSEPEENYLHILTEIMHGRSYFSPEISKMLLTLFHSKQFFGQTQLTSREIQILALIVKDKSSQDIAATLKLSARTIEKHRENIHKKLGTHSKTDLIEYAKANHVI